MDFEDFVQDLPSLDIISQTDKKMTVKLKGVTLQYANALRRVCLNGVPIFAIDTIDIIHNSSVCTMMTSLTLSSHSVKLNKDMSFSPRLVFMASIYCIWSCIISILY